MSYPQPHVATLAALVLAASAAPSQAITWQYLDSYNALGVPSKLQDLSATLPTGLLADIRKRLPETKDIRTNDPKLITDDLGANLILLEDAEITVAFIDEGAGYRNALGYFTFDPGNKPKAFSELTTKIMFPNFSLPTLGGMKYGDAVQLGKFKAGTAVGFTIVSNGWTGSVVNPNQATNAIFTTLKALNPEKPTASDPNLNAHTVLLSKPEAGLLVLGFEDLNRAGGDHDFNDVLIAIQVTPFSAIDRTQVQALVKTVVLDSDGDSIPDTLDAFPLDPERAARRFSPNATGFGSLAFEDLWPKKGDFDMNDLVVAYRAVETLNARNEIVDLKLIYEIRARGAGADNGFAVHFPGLSRDAVDTSRTTLTVGDKAPVALALESGQSDAVFILSTNVTPLTHRPGLSLLHDEQRRQMPALPSRAPGGGYPLPQPLTRAQLGEAPYNPFIYRTTKRGLEVHLVDHPPTAKADLKLFGTLDDRSDLARGRTYRTADDQPWALDVPETWRHPTEWNSITKAYPDFAPWALSAGTTAGNWYQSRMDEPLIFK
jgi:LruC domain-containing protein